MSSPFIRPVASYSFFRFSFPVSGLLFSISFHELRQALAAVQTRLGQKGLEVLADHLVQDGALGLAADVRVLPRTSG